MKNSQLWLIGAGVTLLQLIIGNAMVFYGVIPQLLGIHAVLAAILLVIGIYGYSRVKKFRKENINGNYRIIGDREYIRIFIQ